MNWTKKHDKFALSLNLSDSQGYVLRDILRKGKLSEPSEIEIDLKQTNKWIGKVRPKGEYHRKTIQKAITTLDKCSMGMVTIIKRYNPWIYKILVRPLALVEGIRIAFCASAPNSNGGNPMYRDDHKKAARELLLRNISRLDTFLKKLGMNCNQETLHRMWRYAGGKMSEVEKAVEYMLVCHKEKLEQSESINGEPKGIFKPIAWLHECLKHGRHINVDAGGQLPYFDSILALASFVKGISPPPLAT